MHTAYFETEISNIWYKKMFENLKQLHLFMKTKQMITQSFGIVNL
jgi:hypothetical protein